MSEEQEGIRDRIRSAGEQVAGGLADVVVSSPVFGGAVSAAAAAREKAIEAQQTARGVLNLSSREEADRLERRIRVLSNRLEETEDRLDDALDELRAIRSSKQTDSNPEVEG
ncbi:MAG: hypothetical protein M9938_03665 [Solirubrobacterales bacterium]|nr:hypothetical protein [Solirubrobacterales bacterium]